MCLLFDSSSQMESPTFDNMHIFDGSCTSGTEIYTASYGISTWTGVTGNALELTGLTNGGDVCMCLTSDTSVTYYGYEVLAATYE